MSPQAPMNIRIRIMDLIEVTKHLNAHGHTVVVIASGVQYATLRTYGRARTCLSNSRHWWEFD